MYRGNYRVECDSPDCRGGCSKCDGGWISIPESRAAKIAYRIAAHVVFWSVVVLLFLKLVPHK